MKNKRLLSLLGCCKKHKISLDPEKRAALAKKRWRKVWILRNILIAGDDLLDLTIRNHPSNKMIFFEEFSTGKINNHLTILKKWIVYPWNPLKKLWDVCIGAIKMYYCFAIPYYLGFSNHHQGELIGLDFFFDILLFCDILFQFSTAFYIRQTLIDDWNKIIYKSLSIDLIIDILCVLPLYAIYGNLMWFRILRLFQIKAFKTALDKAVISYIGHKSCISKVAFFSWFK